MPSVPPRPARETGAADPRTIRREVERLRELPTLPIVVQRVADTLANPEADLAEAAALIETDQVLTAQLLRLANSAFYGLSGRIGSVTQALTVLGTTVTRSLLYSTSVLDLRINLTGFWEHSIGTAVAAGALAKRLGLKAPEEVSSAGLLPRWRFPMRVQEPVVHHHAPERARSAPVETAVVHVANTLVRAYGYGFGGDTCVPPVSAAAWRLLGLGPDALDALLEDFEADLYAAVETSRAGGLA